MIDTTTLKTVKDAEELKQKSEDKTKFWSDKIENLDPQPQIDNLDFKGCSFKF